MADTSCKKVLIEDLLNHISPKYNEHLWYGVTKGVFEINKLEIMGNAGSWNLGGDVYDFAVSACTIKYGFDYGDISISTGLRFVGCQVKEEKKNSMIAIKSSLSAVCFLSKKHQPSRYKMRVVFTHFGNNQDDLTIDLDIDQTRELLMILREYVDFDSDKLAIDNYCKNHLTFSGVYPLQLLAMRKIMSVNNIHPKDIPSFKKDLEFAIIAYPAEKVGVYYCYIRFSIRSTLSTLMINNFDSLVLNPTHFKVLYNKNVVFEIIKRHDPEIKYLISSQTIDIIFNKKFGLPFLKKLYDVLVSKIGKQKVTFESGYENFVDEFVFEKI